MIILCMHCIFHNILADPFELRHELDDHVGVIAPCLELIIHLELLLRSIPWVIGTAVRCSS